MCLIYALSQKILKLRNRTLQYWVELYSIRSCILSESVLNFNFCLTSLKQNLLYTVCVYMHVCIYIFKELSKSYILVLYSLEVITYLCSKETNIVLKKSKNLKWLTVKSFWIKFSYWANFCYDIIYSILIFLGTV